MIAGIICAIAVVLIAVAGRKVRNELQSRLFIGRLRSNSSRQLPKFNFEWPTSQAKYEKQLPNALDSIARSLYSGAGFVQALREASTLNEQAVCQDLQRVVYEIDLGESVEQGLYRWTERVKYESVRVTVSSMTLALAAGGNQATAVDSASAAVRRTINAAAVARTHSTDARVSSIGIMSMPFIVSIPLLAFNSGARHFMLGTIYGWIALTIGIGFDIAGMFWMRSLMKQALA